MKKMLKSSASLLGCAAALTLSAQAGAVSVTLEAASGIWTNTNPTVIGEGTSRITWPGAPGSDPSSYRFDETTPLPQAVELGEHVTIGEFSHINNPILPPALASANLEVSYSFGFDFDYDNVIDEYYSGISVFLFNHNETLNSSDPCPDGNANGTRPNQFGCADEVTFELLSNDSSKIDIGGTLYQLDLAGFLVDGDVVSSFWTAEGKRNKAELVAKLTVVPLPAAASLFASVLGVFGLLRLRNRKDSTAAAA